MSRIFTEENGLYQIDCSKAAWATDELNYQYHAANCMLSDVDWVVETNKRLYLVEYKNANIPGAVNPGAFSLQSDKLIEKVEVLSIAEWNADPQYGEFPIQLV